MPDEKKPPIIVKKKIMHGGHHGGAWKVAYADFVTALMALFIVLWLMNSKEEVKQAVGGYFKDPAGTGKLLGTKMTGRGTETFDPKKDTKDDMSKLKEQLQAVLKVIPKFEQIKGNIEFTITEEGLRVELLENEKGIFFESGRPDPTPVGKEILTVLAQQIGKLPNQVAIEGHTDASPYSGMEYSNWELSADRANQARRLMVQNGLKWSQVAQVRGYADQDLHDKEHPGAASNRRVSVIIKYRQAQKELKIPISPAAGAVTPAAPPAVKKSPTPAPKK